MTATARTEAILSREQIRTFHLSGLGLDDAAPSEALLPAAIAQLAGLADLESLYPMCVHPNGFAQPFRKLVNGLEHAPAITSAFREAMGGRPMMAVEDAESRATQALPECPQWEIARLRGLLPEGSFLVGFHTASLVLLHASSAAEARRPQRVRFWEDVKQAASRLREILLLDDGHAPGAVTGESVTASLGFRVREFFKAELLAKTLQRPAVPSLRMERERRLRCEATLAILEEGLHDAANHPGFWVFHPAGFATEAIAKEVLLFGGSLKCADDCFAASLEFCDAALDGLTQVLRALRVARLEMDSTFDSAIHEEMLARFDWQSASLKELFALPPIVVMESAERLGETSLTSFGRLLRSGRPVQMLIVRSGLEHRDLREYNPDYGYLAIAHREAFVLQSSMAELSHLRPGLAAMTRTLRPAVAVIATPRSQYDDRQAWLEENLAVRSHTFPLFTYDPDSGSRMADHLRLFTPPAGEADLTAAHVAAVSPAFRAQFRLAPGDVWNGDQVELAQYLESYTRRPPLAVPFIWVDGPDGNRQRALLTRDLANFCLDRQRAWALFQDLARVEKSQPVEEGNPRQEGARDAIERVIAMLQAG